MKMYRKLFLFLLLGSVAVASCKKDEDPEVPSIAVQQDKTAAKPGETTAFTISANAASGGTLKTLKIEEVISGTSGRVSLKDSTISGTSLGYTFVYTMPSQATGEKELIFTVTDNANLTSSVTKKLTVSATGSDVQTCSSMQLGAQSATPGSSFSTSDCSIYVVAQAKANATKVDMMYFHGATNNATLAAPSDKSVEDFGTFAVNTWSTRNVTMFKRLDSGFDFDAATSASLKTAYDNSTATADTKANDLAISHMYAYKTNGGKYGVFRVKNISGTTSGTITIDTKTQK